MGVNINTGVSLTQVCKSLFKVFGIIIITIFLPYVRKFVTREGGLVCLVILTLPPPPSNFITENVHIGYRRPDSTCGVSPTPAHCASFRSLSPENAIYLAGTGRAGPYLYGSNAVSCGSLGGGLTQE